MNTIHHFLNSSCRLLASGILVLTTGFLSFSQNVVNGSFTGMTGNSVTPNGWTNVLGYDPGTSIGVWPSVDVLDINFNAFFNNAAVAVSPSPDGGTWTGISSLPQIIENEAIEQSVSGFTVGQQYQVSCYVANFGGTPFVDPGIVTVYLNGTAVATSPVLNLVANTWTPISGTFIASATTMDVQIDAIHTTGDAGNGGYFSVDGLVIEPVGPCNAGNTAPTLSQTSFCTIPAGVDLTAITCSNIPAGTSVTWHSAATPSQANTLANSNSVGVGTYYAAFYDAVNNCYSPSQPVTVHPLPVADFDYTSTCANEPVNFTDLSTIASGSITGWSWDFGDNSSAVTQQNPVHTFPGGTSYQVSLTVTSAAGCTHTTTETVTMTAIPNAAFTFSPTDPEVTNPTVQFNNSSTGANAYGWSFDGLSTSVQTNPSFTFPSLPGNYTVVLIAYSGTCSDTATAIVTITDPMSYHVPNIFTPDEDGTNDYFTIPTHNATDLEAIILNRWGELVHTLNSTTDQWDGTINGQQASEGVYFVDYKITDTKGVVTEGHGFVELIRK